MVRLANWTLAHRRVVLLCWLGLVIALTPLAGELSSRVTPGGYESPTTQAAEADSLLAKRFQVSTLGVLVKRPAQPRAGTARRIEKLKRRLSSLTGVQRVVRTRSRLRRVSLMSLTVRGGEDGSLQTARELLDLTASRQGGEIRVLPVGFDVFHVSGAELAQKDLTRARWASSLLLLAVLFLAFRTLAAAAGPVIVAWTSVTVTLGLLALVSELTPLSELVSNGVAMISTALSVDYMLFMISRFREHRTRGHDKHQAVLATVASTGRAVFFAGAVIVVALASLFLADTRAVHSMALGMMIAAVVSVATALIVAPILMSIADQWLIPRSARDGAATDGEGSAFWTRWSNRIVARPVLYMVPALVVLGGLSIPVLHLRDNVRLPGPEILPRDNQVREGYDLAAKAFGPGVLSPVQVVVLPRSPAAGKARRATADVARRLRADPRVASVQPISSPAQAGRKSVAPLAALSVASKQGPYDETTGELVDDIRAGHIAPRAPARLLAGGEPAVARDSTSTLFDALPEVLSVLLGATFLILMLAFRSVLIPLKAVVMTLITLGSTFGILLLLFETGPGTSLLGVSKVGLSPVLPLPLIALAFAIGTDYEVIVISRIRERYLETRDTNDAISYGLARTSRIISSAGLVMIVVFFAFSAGALLPIKHLAYGLGIAVLVDLTLVRLVLVPATMTLLGDANWWLPSWLQRWLPRDKTPASAARTTASTAA